ncbi:HNH endonuclease [Cupriavidus agavae]|uniref:5-methylcytosine-specific restriction protein A n=1 Tax=Cupriavidus agavae TaxID=1001822 RepID=A0A4Q7RKP6_9BURK|nr:5-methylcytosine-specific restriction protein A [Cupriavidus agavae]
MAATQGHGNPDWTRDEVILALELYLTCAGTQSLPGPRDSRVIRLSDELRALPIYPIEGRRKSFRNPEGVAFKLQNLRQVATGRGLANVSSVDRQVWSDFGHLPDHVVRLAQEIRTESATASISSVSGDEGEEFPEGRLLSAAHRRRERDPRVRARLISHRLSSASVLTCDACGTGGPLQDAKLSDAAFEAHHMLPLSRLSASGVKTKVADLALLCAICHRLIHRVMQIRGTTVTISEFQSVLGGNSKS